MDFTAIDFETANRRRDSACQLAAVVVRSGKIVDTAMWMIRPVPLYFSPGNIAIHGITPAKVRSEPTFAEHWPAIAKFLFRDDTSTYDCIIAHNAAFDMGVMLGSLASHSIESPDLPYNCTRLIARQTWPGRPRYGLKPLAEWLGIHFRHHDALEDSVACAKILIAAGLHRGVSTLEELETTLKISRGCVGPSGTQSPSSLRKTRRKTTRAYSVTSSADKDRVYEATSA
jgi:DNA polymerase III subunit epsilon